MKLAHNESCPRKTILLKITGEVIGHQDNALDVQLVRQIADQIKTLKPTHSFGIVVGGGNFFRGDWQAQQLHLSKNTSHYVGMLATMMNGLLLQDIFTSIGLKTVILTAIECPAVGLSISPQNIDWSIKTHDVSIFVGGTGSPYFTTDTTGVLRALQIKAHELWKGTKVDGIYSDNPHTNPQARRYAHLSYSQALSEQLKIMDMAAFVLAQQHKMTTRIFNIFESQALIKAAQDATFGSILSES